MRRLVFVTLCLLLALAGPGLAFEITARLKQVDPECRTAVFVAGGNERRVLPLNHPFLAVALERMAELYEKTGRKDEALKLREEMLALRRKVSDPQHPNTLKVMNNLATSYARTARCRALKPWKKRLPPPRRRRNSPPISHSHRGEDEPARRRTILEWVTQLRVNGRQSHQANRFLVFPKNRVLPVSVKNLSAVGCGATVRWSC